MKVFIKLSNWKKYKTESKVTTTKENKSENAMNRNLTDLQTTTNKALVVTTVFTAVKVKPMSLLTSKTWPPILKRPKKKKSGERRGV